jgi:hypothetical protein
MNLPPRITRSLAAGAVLSAAVLGLASADGAGAVTPPPASALDWLSAELDATADGIFVYDSGFGDFTDHGLTLDAVLALLLGNAHADVAAASLAAIEDDLPSYVQHPDFMDGNGAGKYAGSIAKVLLTEKVAGRATTIDGFDLEAELRSTLLSSGRRAGRFDAEHGDFSNGVTQALAVLALARTSAGVPASAVDFLLDQQCPGGGFRISLDALQPDFTVDEAASTRGCEGDDEADLDATSFALQALLSVRTSALAEPIGDALAFLRAPANAADNANSAGLAGQALRAAGDSNAADAAAAIALALQLTTGPDTGAIALDADGEAAAAGGTIPAASLPEFWRSTAQGVLAFGLGSYGPVVTLPTTSTTGASTTSTTAVAQASSTSTTKAATTSTIPKTGSSSRNEISIGLFLVGLGLAAIGQSRLRARPSS